MSRELVNSFKNDPVYILNPEHYTIQKTQCHVTKEDKNSSNRTISSKHLTLNACNDNHGGTLSIHTQFFLSQTRVPEIMALLKSTCPLNPMHPYI
jgi:hypothetical protein